MLIQLLRWRQLTSIFIFSGFFLVAVALMVVGCFVQYTGISSLLTYVVCIILFSAAYLFYYGFIAVPQSAFFNWVAFFFLFPKKAIRPEYTVLLAKITGQNAFSFYEIVETVCIFTLVLVMLLKRSVRPANSPPWASVKALVVAYCLVIGVGGVNFFLCVAELKPSDYDAVLMWRSFWPLIVGLVIWFGAKRFVCTPSDISKILILGVLAGAGLSLEFFVSKYTSILPPQVLYFEFDPQLGQFRSAWQSTGMESGLLVGQYMILAISCACGYLLFRRCFVSVLWVSIFMFVVLYTYNRGSLAAAGLSSLVIFWFAKSRWRPMIVFCFLCLISIIISPWAGKENVVSAIGVAEAKTSDRSFFDLRSLYERLGAQMRGMEVFMAMPAFGAGPGHLWARMADTNIPRIFAVEARNADSARMYEIAMDPEHHTNSHNLGVDFMAEYGVCGLWLDICFLWTVGMLFWRICDRQFNLRHEVYNRISRLQCISAFGAVLGLLGFYLTQATPLILGVLFLMLAVAVRAHHNTIKDFV